MSLVVDYIDHKDPVHRHKRKTMTVTRKQQPEVWLKQRKGEITIISHRLKKNPHNPHRKRRSPKRHTVKAHNRNGSRVISYQRGRGTQKSKVTRVRKLTPEEQRLRLRDEIEVLKGDIAYYEEDIIPNLYSKASRLQVGSFAYRRTLGALTLHRDELKDYKDELKFLKAVKKEMGEHPWMTKKVASRVVREHMAKGHNPYKPPGVERRERYARVRQRQQVRYGGV